MSGNCKIKDDLSSCEAALPELEAAGMEPEVERATEVVGPANSGAAAAEETESAPESAVRGGKASAMKAALGGREEVPKAAE